MHYYYYKDYCVTYTVFGAHLIRDNILLAVATKDRPAEAPRIEDTNWYSWYDEAREEVRKDKGLLYLLRLVG